MTATLDSLTAGQLSTVYAELTGSQPVRFNSKINGRKRVAAALERSGRTLESALAALNGGFEADPPVELTNYSPEPTVATERAPRQTRSPEVNGIALLSMVVAPVGKSMRVYAYGHRTRADGRPSVEARMSIDGQPKGGFPNKAVASEWVRQRFGSEAAAVDWARSEASKGTRLNDPKYAGWSKTIVAEVSFS